MQTGRIGVERFVELVSTNPARLFGLYPRKGTIAIGSDADLVVWDPSASKTISAKRQLSRIDYNVFEGFVCTGAPVVTISRGKLAWRTGDLRATRGDGRYVERPAFSPVHVANSTWKTETAPKGVARGGITP